MAKCVSERARFVRGEFDGQSVARPAPEHKLKGVPSPRSDLHAVEDLRWVM
jgi:hypothetical protein